MKRERFFLPIALFVLLMAFALGKLGFAAYNSEVETLSLWDFMLTWFRGLPLDVRTAAIILLIPALCTFQNRISLRKLLIPYFSIIAIAISSVTVADAVMYEFWKFKLSSVILSYASSPEGMTSSVSHSFIVIRFLTLVVYAVAITLSLAWVTPKQARKDLKISLVLLVIAIFPIDVALCYNSQQSLFRNHTATNPVYAFLVSFWQDSKYDYFNNDECQRMVASLYPSDTEDITDTLLNTSHPNILFIQMESFGGKFVSELGGVPNVAVNLSRLIPSGIFFDEYYSNSFRTDRGTVSLQSGTISHPTISLMKEQQYHHLLSSLPHKLGDNGYETIYFYGGPMTNMGKQVYLNDMDFCTFYDINIFPEEERGSTWGVHDGPAAMKLLKLLEEQDTLKSWYLTFQMLSSHEPWSVPYHHLEDERLNAFAYTDQCVGDLVDSLRHSPLWDNLLIIIIPDHGYLYEETYEDPEFFHSPMLWLGGAVRQPRLIHTLMNQSDIAATLLSQLGITHADFPMSRNIFSKNYTYPFVYCNYPAGIMLKDSSGVSVFDIVASRPISQRPIQSDERIHKAKAILQYFHQQLNR